MASPWLAWPSGTNPVALTKRVARAHERFVSTGAQAPAMREVVLDSRRRSRDSGIDPDGTLAPVDLLDDELEAYRAAHPLAAVMPLVRRLLVDDAVDCDLLVAVSDDVGRLLWVEGGPSLRSRAESMHFMAGARWAEADAGTNAPGIALALDHGVQIYAHEHYSRIAQPWSCSAAPIHDPVTGRILGVLDVTGGDLVAAPQSMSLVQAAVHAIESELSLTARGRTGPTERGSHRRLEVLGRDCAVVHLDSVATALSQRHSEMLLLLALHPEGLTTEQLAIQLHDDDHHALVTIRAEVSRLRSVLGPLAPMSRPYRLPHAFETDAAQVMRLLRAGDVAQALAAYPGPVLPHSQAPGVVRARRHLHDQLRASLLASHDADLLLAWSERPDGGDDVEVLGAALRRLPVGSPQHTLARMRLAALDEEFGATFVQPPRS